MDMCLYVPNRCAIRLLRSICRNSIRLFNSFQSYHKNFPKTEGNFNFASIVTTKVNKNSLKNFPYLISKIY